MHLSSRRRAPLVGALALSLVAAVSAAVGTVEAASANLPTPHSASRGPAGAAKTRPIKVRVDHRLFGVHDANLTSLSRPTTGSIRLWDAGVTWQAMQPHPGQIDFSRLDTIVADAWANHTEVTLVTAMTPTWAAAPENTFTDGTEAPNPDDFAAYVGAVMDRYKNYDGSGRPGIANYQVWNEANIGTFWNGTPQQMADLVKTEYDVRAAHDPSVKLIGPAQVSRLSYQRIWTRDFYRLSATGGLPVWKYLDAISLNLYPVETYPTSSGGTRFGTPEDSMALLASVRAYLAKDGVPASMPIWNTEVNYGMGRGTASVPISDAAQIANVMRTYLLNAAQGVGRVEWYAYDMGQLPSGGTLGNTLLTDPSNRAAGLLTPAGASLARIESWMNGTLVGTATQRPCATDTKGTYTCVIRYATGVGRVYWNPYRQANVRLVTSARKRVDEFGAVTSVKGGQKLRVGYMPVLVRSTK
ncbi:beta-galactosidase [Nocardioides cynanchi]|uniref:beta-galactosidase n=1 Tax=Nocardioides cynanchi TaxID=2558918 RepID=UPI001246C0DF|nr:beta-galactosidase [Nocardioides cynanchi]